MDMIAIRERYHALKAELKRQITASGKWVLVPALLDELNTLRRQYETSLAATR